MKDSTNSLSFKNIKDLFNAIEKTSSPPTMFIGICGNCETTRTFLINKKGNNKCEKCGKDWLSSNKYYESIS